MLPLSSIIAAPKGPKKGPPPRVGSSQKTAPSSAPFSAKDAAPSEALLPQMRTRRGCSATSPMVASARIDDSAAQSRESSWCSVLA